MNKPKQKRLTKAGWKVGTAQDFLKLSDEEVALIDLKLSLADSVKRRRVRQKITQQDLANRLGSSQSRIAKAESADPAVSLELLVRCLLALGASNREIGRAISASTRTPAA